MLKSGPAIAVKGIITPVITPLLAYDKLDHKGLEKLVEHLIRGGVHGIFVLGTNGEFTGLSRRLRHEMVEAVCLLVDQRIPVLAGITDTSMEESISLAETACKHGAAGLVLAPPYYFPMSQVEMLSYFERMAGSLPLPFYIYNIPSTTHAEIRVETVTKAAEIHGIAGIKDSTGDADYFNQLIRSLKQIPDFSVFMGSDEMMAEALLSGASGCISGGSNAFPSLFASLYEAARQNNTEKARELQEKVLEFNGYIGRFGRGVSSYIRVMKGFLDGLGICGDVMASPFQPISDQDKRQIRQYIQKHCQ